jgi:RNA polymerase sigma factor FliA
MSATAAYRRTAADGAAELLARHGDLVRRIAYHLVARLPASIEVDDLIQAGLIGLMEAARHYNGAMGASF